MTAGRAEVASLAERVFAALNTLLCGQRGKEPCADAIADVARQALRLPMLAVLELDERREVLVARASSGVPETLSARVSKVRVDRVPSFSPLLNGDVSHVFLDLEKGDVVGERPIRDSGLQGARVLCFPLGSDALPQGLVAFVLPLGSRLHEDSLEGLRASARLLELALCNARRMRAANLRVAAVEASLRTSATMLFTAESLAENQELDAVVRVLTDVVHDVTRRKSVAVWLAEEGTQHLVLLQSRGRVAAPDRHRVELRDLDPLVLTAVAERRSLFVEGGVSPAFGAVGEGRRARFLIVPLITDKGLLGTIEVEERDVDPEAVKRDKQLVEGIAFQAVAAIEGARLYERQRRSGQIRALLNEINALLAESLERRDVLNEVTRLAAEGLRADSGAMALPEGEAWVVRYSCDGDRWVPQRPLQDLDVELASEAMRQKAPFLRLQPAEEWGLTHAAQRPGTLVVPLRLHDRVLGALFFAKSDWLPVLDSETLDFATKLAASVSLALGNQRMYEHEHRIAETLQQALLTVPGRLPGGEIAHRYRAATENARVGGDFYDAFEMKGKIVVAIGDVSGKGVDAATLASLAKNALRSHMLDMGSPAEALRKVNAVVYAFTEPAVFLTAFVGLLDPRTGMLRYASAGHPPPFKVGVDGVTAAEGSGVLLGAFDDIAYRQHELFMSPRDVLFLYTDGLVEAPGPEERYGYERLKRQLLERPRDDLEGFVDAVFDDVRAYSLTELQDDVALLALRLGTTRRQARRPAAR